MTLATDHIRKICYESLAKSFLNPESELYIKNITGDQWYELIKNPQSVDTQLLQEAFDEARRRYAALEEEEMLKEYYEMLEEEYEQIKRENQAEIERLRAADEGYTIDAWYNQGE